LIGSLKKKKNYIMDAPKNLEHMKLLHFQTISVYERGITFATTYGIKINCYMMGVRNTLGTPENAKILLEPIGNIMGTRKEEDAICRCGRDNR
jgi:hypothetical protein